MRADVFRNGTSEAETLNQPFGCNRKSKPIATQFAHDGADKTAPQPRQCNKQALNFNDQKQLEVTK